MYAKSPIIAQRMLIFSLVLFTFLIAGCSSSAGDGDGNGPEIIEASTGVFLDSAVENLNYVTVTGSGTTDQDGRYTCSNGEMITFSIGPMEFPTIAASVLTTPLSLAGSQSVLDQQTTNIARLLQSLDDDGDPSNGIRIPEGAAAVASPIDFNLDTSAFEASAADIDLVSGAGGINNTLISEEAARSHLEDTITDLASSIVGVWSTTDGAYFSHLVLFADGTFVYGENDEFGTLPEENGQKSAPISMTQ